MKKIKKLSLNKEIISSLQEKQMKSFIGGAVLASGGATSNNTCGGCQPPCITQADSCLVAAANINPPSCCKKTCN